ncbi:Bax inhibitor-1/YccA family protein [Cellulomonas citrea]|uniref:Bax inhibitor-1/YccA family protein n=1 Tax=Cellulomonas citrea TaxID=1909423 RepID=UPI00135C07F7|nr:Bax inhibitor-1/YccA family protein [Cellulomonas citrea]
MSNPVFSSSPVFGDPRKQKQGQPGAVQTYGMPGAQTADAASLENLYTAPSATSAQMRRMTYDDVVVKTGGLLALLVVVAAATWAVTPQLPWLYLPAALVGLVLGLVNSFKKNPSPALIVAYTIAEGVFLGGISYLFQNLAVQGSSTGTAQPIVLQAVLGTFVTFAASLILFRSGKVRVTPKFTRWLLIAMVGYLGFSLVNVLLMLVMPGSAWGPLRNGPWGIIAGLVAVGLAAASLIVDFDSIKRGVEQGVPAKFAWTAAFGLIVTLVWLYLELLRLFSILSGRN